MKKVGGGWTGAPPGKEESEEGNPFRDQENCAPAVLLEIVLKKAFTGASLQGKFLFSSIIIFSSRVGRGEQEVRVLGEGRLERGVLISYFLYIYWDCGMKKVDGLEAKFSTCAQATWRQRLSSPLFFRSGQGALPFPAPKWGSSYPAHFLGCWSQPSSSVLPRRRHRSKTGVG